MLIAFAASCVFDAMVILRANLLLSEITDRADWRNMLWRFQASGFDSLRTFIDVDYIKGAPLKIAVASVIGTFMGVIGGTVGVCVGPQLRRRRPWRSSDDRRCSRHRLQHRRWPRIAPRPAGRPALNVHLGFTPWTYT
jgi:hypothetical protein